jgi:hypothetical protein
MEKIMTQVVHQIKMGDVEDPDIMVADPIWKWQQTESGKWIMDNSVEKPSWHRHPDHHGFGWVYEIHAYFTPKQLTYWKLRFE